MPARLNHDEAFKWVASGVLLVWALSAHRPIVGLIAVAVAALDIQVMVLWAAFVGSLFTAVTTVVLGLAVLLPLQFFPAHKVNDKRANKIRVGAIGCIWVSSLLCAAVSPGVRPRSSCLATTVLECSWHLQRLRSLDTGASRCASSSRR